MVDAVNIVSVVTTDPRVAVPSRTAGATPVAPVAAVREPKTSAPTQLASLAKSVASAAPVDTDRVAQIKQAIANGTFPILPATIADQMLAFRYDWMSNDQA